MASIETSATRYATTVDGAELAFRVVGDGPSDIFWSFSQLSDVETIWDYPPIAEFLADLATGSRLVVHDRRGMGRSTGGPSDLETDVADLLVLLDAAAAARPHLLAAGPLGGGIYAAFAQAHPERVAGLVWHGGQARSRWAPDYPWGETDAEHEEYEAQLAGGWGTLPFAADFVAGGAPSMAGDAETVRFFAHWMRRTSTAQEALEYSRRWDAVDLRTMLAGLAVPTLVTTRGIDPAEGAHVASLIPGAAFRAVQGVDFMPFFDREPVVEVIREFLAQGSGRSMPA